MIELSIDWRVVSIESVFTNVFPTLCLKSFLDSAHKVAIKNALEFFRDNTNNCAKNLFRNVKWTKWFIPLNWLFDLIIHNRIDAVARNRCFVWNCFTFFRYSTVFIESNQFNCMLLFTHYVYLYFLQISGKSNRTHCSHFDLHINCKSSFFFFLFFLTVKKMCTNEKNLHLISLDCIHLETNEQMKSISIENGKYMTKPCFHKCYLYSKIRNECQSMEFWTPTNRVEETLSIK